MSFLLDMFVPDFLHILFVILFLSLIASTILLIWKPEKGIILNFIQFPLRISFAIYSFWFLSYFFIDFKNFQMQFFTIPMMLEFIRIVGELIIFKKLKKELK